MIKNNKQKETVFIKIAETISSLSSCITRQVGAVLVRDNMILSTGYNGTPKGVLNCNQGGCTRCNSNIPSGKDLDKCICVHAEVNTIIQAAYNGISTRNSKLYCTHKPCSNCLKLLINAGVTEVKYLHNYPSEIDRKLNEKIKVTQWK